MNRYTQCTSAGVATEESLDSFSLGDSLNSGIDNDVVMVNALAAEDTCVALARPLYRPIESTIKRSRNME